MKTANDIINWLFQSGLLAWAFYFALAIAKPWVANKIKHAKTAQQRETWTLLEQVAMATVNSLVSSSKTGEQKFDQASTQVASYLSDRGIHIDMKDIQTAVQAAYEKSELTHKSKSIVKATPEGITAKIIAGKVDPNMPGASAMKPAKPYNADTAKKTKGIPTDNLQDIAVQVPQTKEGATNAEN